MGYIALTVSLCVVKTNIFGLKPSSARILYKLMTLTEHFYKKQKDYIYTVVLKYTKYDLEEFLQVADLWRMPTCLLSHTISSVLVWSMTTFFTEELPIISAEGNCRSKSEVAAWVGPLPPLPFFHLFWAWRLPWVPELRIKISCCCWVFFWLDTVFNIDSFCKSENCKNKIGIDM